MDTVWTDEFRGWIRDCIWKHKVERKRRFRADQYESTRDEVSRFMDDFSKHWADRGVRFTFDDLRVLFEQVYAMWESVR